MQFRGNWLKDTGQVLNTNQKVVLRFLKNTFQEAALSWFADFNNQMASI